jgi:hypothetical protein
MRALRQHPADIATQAAIGGAWGFRVVRFTGDPARPYEELATKPTLAAAGSWRSRSHKAVYRAPHIRLTQQLIHFFRPNIYSPPHAHL